MREKDSAVREVEAAMEEEKAETATSEKRSSGACVEGEGASMKRSIPSHATFSVNVTSLSVTRRRDVSYNALADVSRQSRKRNPPRPSVLLQMHSLAVMWRIIRRDLSDRLRYIAPPVMDVEELISVNVSDVKVKAIWVKEGE